MPIINTVLGGGSSEPQDNSIEVILSGDAYPALPNKKVMLNKSGTPPIAGENMYGDFDIIHLITDNKSGAYFSSKHNILTVGYSNRVNTLYKYDTISSKFNYITAKTTAMANSSWYYNHKYDCFCTGNAIYAFDAKNMTFTLILSGFSTTNAVSYDGQYLFCRNASDTKSIDIYKFEYDEDNLIATVSLLTTIAVNISYDINELLLSIDDYTLSVKYYANAGYRWDIYRISIDETSDTPVIISDTPIITYISSDIKILSKYYYLMHQFLIKYDDAGTQETISTSVDLPDIYPTYNMGNGVIYFKANNNYRLFVPMNTESFTANDFKYINTNGIYVTDTKYVNVGDYSPVVPIIRTFTSDYSSYTDSPTNINFAINYCDDNGIVGRSNYDTYLYAPTNGVYDGSVKSTFIGTWYYYKRYMNNGLISAYRYNRYLYTISGITNTNYRVSNYSISNYIGQFADTYYFCPYGSQDSTSYTSFLKLNPETGTLDGYSITATQNGGAVHIVDGEYYMQYGGNVYKFTFNEDNKKYTLTQDTTKYVTGIPYSTSYGTVLCEMTKDNKYNLYATKYCEYNTENSTFEWKNYPTAITDKVAEVGSSISELHQVYYDNSFMLNLANGMQLLCKYTDSMDDVTATIIPASDIGRLYMTPHKIYSWRTYQDGGLSNSYLYEFYRGELTFSNAYPKYTAFSRTNSLFNDTSLTGFLTGESRIDENDIVIAKVNTVLPTQGE